MKHIINNCLGIRKRAIFAVFFFAFSFSVFAPTSYSQDKPKPKVEEQEITKSLLDYYNSGGTIMHFILICFIGTTACIIYCFLRISPNKMVPQAHVGLLTKHMQSHEVSAAYEFCNNNDNPFTRILSSALLKVNFERDLANKASMEAAAIESIDQEETALMQWVNYLNVFATIAPMLGLLGTVTGMIASFDALAAGKSEPSDLAGGIGTAMLTTAGGLLAGIPSMFFYFFFRNKLMTIISKIQKHVSFLVDVLSGEVNISDDGAPIDEEQPPA